MSVPKYCPACGARYLRAYGITEDDRWILECRKCGRVWAVEDITEGVIPALELVLEEI